MLELVGQKTQVKFYSDGQLYEEFQRLADQQGMKISNFFQQRKLR